MLRRISLVLALSAMATCALAGAASADPVKSRSSLIIPASCGGEPVVVAVNGNGEFTAAHVVSDTSVFVPQSFDLTFEQTPPGGPTESETDTSAKHNTHGDLVTCDIDFSQSFPDGSMLHLEGTVTGFFTPSSS